ncbi:hypothetical protein FHS16_002511 [Paenibacillus endophyticus]|uniref:Uncharacterized protein n=1 Tax=Paenibacillus endophyticus TaxID=1294268 RepID=A0A7W5C7A4_9BACL|nr:hypothetical protein [Paenibacillus endophyticus]
MELYIVISSIFGWLFISKLQRSFIIFTTISNYIVVKAILSVLIGWALMPFYLISYLFKFVRYITKGFSRTT